MCTAISFKKKNFFFGRNLDYDYSFGESICITPRNYRFSYRNYNNEETSHYAIIGIAYIDKNYPLYYDAMNEMGLCIAGLNFVHNAKYSQILDKNKNNIAQFELIPYLLSKCKNVDEVIKLLKKTNVTETNYSDNLKCAELHYLIADKNKCITLEFTESGVHIYNNKVGVLTNNPPFETQILNLNNYTNLSNKQPKRSSFKGEKLNLYSLGLGAVGLPGDLSSMSRFIKVAFTKNYSICDMDDLSEINQFFHILHSVEQQNGCTETTKNYYEKTIYTSCMDVNNLTFYITTYFNHRIRGVKLTDYDLKSKELIATNIETKEDVEILKIR